MAPLRPCISGRAALAQRGETVGADILGPEKTFPGDAAQVIAFQQFPVRKCDGMDQDIQVRPMFIEAGE